MAPFLLFLPSLFRCFIQKTWLRRTVSLKLNFCRKDDLIPVKCPRKPTDAFEGSSQRTASVRAQTLFVASEVDHCTVDLVSNSYPWHALSKVDSRAVLPLAATK